MRRLLGRREEGLSWWTKEKGAWVKIRVFSFLFQIIRSAHFYCSLHLHFYPSHPSVTTCTPVFYLIHLHVYLFLFSSYTSIYDNPAPPLCFCLLGFRCIFTSSRTSTITNPAPCTHFLLLFWICFIFYSLHPSFNARTPPVYFAHPYVW